MSSRNREIVDRANAAFTRNDVEGLLALCTDDFEWTMVGYPTARGKDEVRKWMAQAPSEPPRFSVDTTVAEGDHVVCIGDMTMTENGTPVDYSYCDVWRLSGDRIAALKAFVVKKKA